MNNTKRERMKDVLTTLTQRDNGYVAADSSSEAKGSDPRRALITKLLCDRFNAQLATAGLGLAQARLSWPRALSPAEAFVKLQQLGLLDQSRHVDLPPPANLPLVD